ncbi:MAG: citrate synthase [Coriobacteriales bacterium]|jgi:citrate synthase
MRRDAFDLYDHFESCNYIDPRYYERSNVKRGLRNADGSGVVAGVTNISSVHGYVLSEGDRVPCEGELTLRGYSINDLVGGTAGRGRFGYEELAYLLLTGVLPNQQELDSFQVLIDEYRDLPKGFVNDNLLTRPSDNVMNMLARSILQLYAQDPNANSMTAKHEIDTAVMLISTMPRLAVLSYYAIQQRFYHKDMVWHPAVAGLTMAETVLDMLRPDHEYTAEEAHMLDVLLMLQAEHGGGNNSTFTCRVVTSSGTDPYSAYAAAIGSLKGPRHGGANLKVREMIKDLEATTEDWTDEDQVAEYLRAVLNKQAYDHAGLIYGMGHAVYTLSDPRAVICHSYASKMAAGTEFEPELRLLETIERLTPDIIAEVKGTRKAICANIDLYTGFVYDMLGIPEDLYTPMFATARITGWAAHRFEEIVSGKRIIRPAYRTTLQNRAYEPLEERPAIEGFHAPESEAPSEPTSAYDAYGD